MELRRTYQILIPNKDQEALSRLGYSIEDLVGECTRLIDVGSSEALSLVRNRDGDVYWTESWEAYCSKKVEVLHGPVEWEGCETGWSVI